MTRCSTAFAVIALTACGLEGGQAPDSDLRAQAETGDALLDQLQALPGVAVTELAPRPGIRQFMLRVTQPVDHFHPGGPTFEQRVVLRHRSVTAPMTLATTGYGLFAPVARDNEISLLLAGNALTVEHRYFEESTPEPADPRYLTLQQAAADHHHVVELLRPIYTGAWISTGASKGGMTSIYHRRFYPNDVDATVAYVAPQSYTTNDPRYAAFLERVGSPACRAKIVDLQRALLTRRAELLPGFEAQAAEFGLTYEQVGGLEIAYEHAVQELRFATWQYFDEALCAELPSPTDPADTLAAFFDLIVGPSTLASDQTLTQFGSYYYQAATQLGSYGPLERHLRDLIQFPGTYRVERYSPLPVTRFDLFSVPEIQLWLATRGERVMLIYGENDPWSAGGFVLGGARDSFRFVVPGGNHGSSLGALPDEARAQAFAALARWTGVTPAAPTRASKSAASAFGLGAPDPDDGTFDRQRFRPRR